MYLPEMFKNEDAAGVEAFLKANTFATLVTLGKDGLIASHVPTLVVTEPKPHGAIECHLARGNPQWSGADPSVEALMIFQGPEAYIRPGWYPSKAEHGKVVPTWNYSVVHAYGRLVVHDDRDWLKRHVSEITAQMETGQAAPWATSDAPDSFIAAMTRGIVGLSLVVTRLEAKWKMSQNREDRDRVGVISGLKARAEGADSVVAAEVERWRKPGETA